jgi:hypothetical protein
VVDSPDYFLDAMLTCLAKDVTSVRRSKVNGETKLLRTVALSEWLREDSRYDLIICPLMLDSWASLLIPTPMSRSCANFTKSFAPQACCISACSSAAIG